MPRTYFFNISKVIKFIVSFFLGWEGVIRKDWLSVHFWYILKAAPSIFR